LAPLGKLGNACSFPFARRAILDRGDTIEPKGTPMQLSPVNTSEVAILSRVLEPEKTTLSPETARDLLALDFTPADKDRMRELSAKARAGTLTPAEQAAINNYERVGHLLNVLQSKARRSLKGRRGTNGKAKPH
jgi:hypothetical protein